MKLEYDTSDRVREAAEMIQETANNFVLKHRDTDAVIQAIWALAQVLGFSLAVNPPPPHILDAIINRIRECADIDPSEIETTAINIGFQ